MRNIYLAVIRGDRKGLFATVLKGILYVLSLGYFVGYKLRAALYKVGILKSTKLPCKVISMGNITVGGTGKTPAVEWLAKWFVSRNMKVAILSRGYGAIPSQDVDDESPFDLSVENIIRVTGKDRVSLAKRVIAEYKSDIIILDDGFQHFRIKRDIDILTVDATNPFANGYLLPRGFLRETPSSIKRADVILLTRVNQTSGEELALLKTRLQPITVDRCIVESIHKPIYVKNIFKAETTHYAEWLKGRKCYAFCGIGNADAFRKTVESLGAELVRFRHFPDHYNYTELEIRQIVAEAQEFMADILITTEKDAIRLRSIGDSFALPIFFLKIELDIIKNLELMEKKLEALMSAVAKEVSPSTK
ncbi:MAG: tetraacyldisaccharide 4'-kinase [Candidatus Schekmanbacteria bacterium RBG_16_38_10]|uniref:Tetraacyldisaccharide 4'-kinase n=1 Tax=Candidatus Schekmanbacteria bacterium RBG_16_38_10 TaxID=1817879 RepID=A0A1F7S1E5_9BACT|nr:MAG: tetraacyldisaccharide 4'-kinase [Candidatus Schekmanbacteria bacterium RBG_16_38_10]